MKVSIGGVLCGRDATTGRFIPRAQAKKRRKTAIVQRIRTARLKSGRFAKRVR